MSVDDHGLEAIRKSAVEIVPGSKAEYYIRTLAQGTFKVLALTSSNPTSQYTVTDVAKSFPLSGTTSIGINGITVYNGSELDSIYLSANPLVRAGFLHNTVDGGYEVGPGESLNIACSAGITIYIICKTGKTADVTFTEWV